MNKRKATSYTNNWCSKCVKICYKSLGSKPTIRWENNPITKQVSEFKKNQMAIKIYRLSNKDLNCRKFKCILRRLTKIKFKKCY